MKNPYTINVQEKEIRVEFTEKSYGPGAESPDPERAMAMILSQKTEGLVCRPDGFFHLKNEDGDWVETRDPSEAAGILENVCRKVREGMGALNVEWSSLFGEEKSVEDTREKLINQVQKSIG